MDVKTGFNTEFGEYKFDVLVGEIDLARILAEHEIPPDAPLTALEAYRILRLTAERFCEAERSQHDRKYKGDVRLEMKKLREQLDGQISAVKQRLGLDAD